MALCLLASDGLWRQMFGTARLTRVRAFSSLQVPQSKTSGAIKNPATRNRTRDHLIAATLYSQMLYQLSYSRSWLHMFRVLRKCCAPMSCDGLFQLSLMFWNVLFTRLPRMCMGLRAKADPGRNRTCNFWFPGQRLIHQATRVTSRMSSLLVPAMCSREACGRDARCRNAAFRMQLWRKYEESNEEVFKKGGLRGGCWGSVSKQ